jgi:hypothetical protein
MEQYLNENNLRNGKLDAKYNPFTGVGSLLERQSLVLSDLDYELNLPMSMMNLSWIQLLCECGSFQEFVNRNAGANEILNKAFDPLNTLKDIFTDTRLDHDMEYWCAVGIKITNKDTFKQSPFILRGAQRKLLLALEGMRLSNVPIRIVLLKARQWGGSTLVEFYMMWLQQRHRENWHMVICAQDDGAAKNIREMYMNAARTYPDEIGSITFKPYAKSPKNQICVETGGIVGVGSVKNPDQFRSYNYAMAHLSEVGVWQDTPRRTAMAIISALKETVPDQPYTVVVEESTANGLNYFYDSWISAEKGNTRYKGVFVPWFEIDRCRIPVENPEAFVTTWSDYEKFQWSLGATIEGIAWYRNHMADKKYSDWKMMEENPATPEEAFQSSGQKVFAPIYINAMRKDNKEPIFIGDVYGEARIGENALKNIRLEKFPNGNLQIWELPDTDNEYEDRYVVSVDIGGRTEKADNSIIRVFDRKGMIEGGDLKAVLTWCGHVDQDILAWKAAQIATLYDNALLAPESNSLKKEEEGDHFQTILNQIKNHYRNIYVRNDEEKFGDDFVPKYGFQTTHKTKGLAIDALNSAARERHLKDLNQQEGFCLYEPDKEVCNEMNYFETKTDGSQGAVQGKRDDHVITTAIGTHLAINVMPMPRLKRREVVKRRTGYKSESSFE